MTDESFIHRAFDLMDAMTDMAGPLDVQNAVHDIASRCGYEYFTITRLPQPSDRLAPNVLLNIWPQGWLQHYDRAGYYKFDPVVRHCYTTIEPFHWGDVLYYDETIVRARRVMHEAGEHGMAHGFCVPIHDALGFQAVVSLAGRRVAMTNRVQRAVHMVSLCAWISADRTTRRPAKRRALLLSGRERDVLCWAAKGKKAGEVADILGVSQETVVHHLKSARAKLGTTNTTHSVVEAMRRREISV